MRPLLISLLIPACGGASAAEQSEPIECDSPVSPGAVRSLGGSCGLSFLAALPPLLTEATPTGCTEWSAPKWSSDGCTLDLHRVCPVITTEPGEAQIIAHLSSAAGEVLVAVEWQSGSACVGVYEVESR